MSWNATFFITSALFGLGLAIDGFIISLSNGLKYNKTGKWQILLGAVVFALFQFVAVLIGWLCVTELTKYFSFIEDILSYIALILLSFIGTKMIVNGAKNCRKKYKLHNTVQQKSKETLKNKLKKQNKNVKAYLKHYTNKVKKVLHIEKIKISVLTNFNKKIIFNKKWAITLLIQGFITSVDALSVGFVISNYMVCFAIICALIISTITLNMYIIGFKIGKKFGVRLGSKAEIVGGIFFILLGIEIFVCSFL